MRSKIIGHQIDHDYKIMIHWAIFKQYDRDIDNLPVPSSRNNFIHHNKQITFKSIVKPKDK